VTADDVSLAQGVLFRLRGEGLASAEHARQLDQVANPNDAYRKVDLHAIRLCE
jgi:hypothetical protein